MILNVSSKKFDISCNFFMNFYEFSVFMIFLDFKIFC